MAAETPPVTARRLRFGPFLLDLTTEQLLRDGAPVHLRRLCWELLLTFVRNPDQLFSTDALMSTLWPDTAVEPQNLTNLVFQLRKGLGEGDAAGYIATVPRRGFRFTATVRPELSEPNPEPSSPQDSASRPYFVGRKAQLACLEECWQRACGGQRRTVFIEGDPGIGKTSLVEALLERLRGSFFLLARAGCCDGVGRREPFTAFFTAVEQLRHSMDLLPVLRRYAPTWVVQMPWLLEADEMQALRNSLLGTGEGRLLREGVQLIEEISRQAPMLIILENVHWADDATVDLMGALADRADPACVMLIATYRHTEVATSRHPVGKLVTRLAAYGDRAVRLLLPPLLQADIKSYLASRLGDAVAADLAPILELKSGGNPLFLRTMLDVLIESGRLVDDAGQWRVTVPTATLDPGLPHGLREMIEQQIASLPALAVELLQTAAAAGATFTSTEVAAGLGREDLEVDDACVELARAGTFLQRRGAEQWPDGSVGGIFSFTHALYQRAFYDRLPAGRAHVLHGRIGERLERGYGEESIEIAARLAQHFEAARDMVRSAQYHELAAFHAFGRFAYRDTIAHLDGAIASLRKLPASLQRPEREAEWCLQRANLGNSVEGFHSAAVRQAYDRAFELAQIAGDGLLAFRGQMGCCMNRILNGWSADGIERGAWLVAHAQSGHPELLAAAHLYNAYAISSLDLRAALSESLAAETALPLAAPGLPVDTDLRSAIDVHRAIIVAMAGNAREALALAKRGSERIEAVGSLPARVAMATFAAVAATFAGAADAAIDHSQVALEIGERNVITHYVTTARVCHAWGQWRLGRATIETFEAAVVDRQRLGHMLYNPWFEALVSDAWLRAGEIEKARALLRTNLDENHTLHAEHLRLRALFEAAAGGSPRPGLERARALAQRQGAGLFEARAAAELDKCNA